MGLLLGLLGSAGLGKKARQRLDDGLFLRVVELLPQARLRDRDVAEVEIQLWHGSPGLHPMLLACRRYAGGGHPPGCGPGANLQATRRVEKFAGHRW